MDLRIDKRSALVLGGSSGLGFGIASALAREGAQVTLSSRNRVHLAKAASEIRSASGREIETRECDLASAEAVKELISSVPKVDILVLNGGGPPLASLLDVGADAWKTHFQMMFISLTEVAQAYLTPMRQQKWGRILIVVSSGVIQPIPNLGISNALRLALVGWAKSLSREVAADGVTVNCIAPGRILTDRVVNLDAAAAARESVPVEEIRKRSMSTIPAGRYGTPNEFGDVACFLASDLASYVTGSVHRVDGGMIGAL